MMTAKERAEQRLNCFYVAVNIMREKRPRPTTKDILNEAKKVWEWVSDVKGDNK